MSYCLLSTETFAILLKSQKSQTASLFFCKVHTEEPWRGGTAYSLTIKSKRDLTVTHVPAPLYSKTSSQLCPSPISLFSSHLPPQHTTLLLPHMDTSPNWVEKTRAFQWFHLAVDVKCSVWCLLGWQREPAGCEHSTQVSPCALPMGSCLTGSLQRLCQPDTARTRWLPVCAHTHGTFECCRLHSSSVWGHAYQFTLSLWGESGLAD